MPRGERHVFVVSVRGDGFFCRFPGGVPLAHYLGSILRPRISRECCLSSRYMSAFLEHGGVPGLRFFFEPTSVGGPKGAMLSSSSATPANGFVRREVMGSWETRVVSSGLRCINGLCSGRRRSKQICSGGNVTPALSTRKKKDVERIGAMRCAPRCHVHGLARERAFQLVSMSRRDVSAVRTTKVDHARRCGLTNGSVMIDYLCRLLHGLLVRGGGRRSGAL